MRIYRDNGFAVIENIASYNLNQLFVEQVGNIIRITQLGSNRGEIRVHFTIIKDGFGNAIGETAQEVFDYLEDVPYEPIGNTGGIGSVDRYVLSSNRPLRSATANTATTIACSATTGMTVRIDYSTDNGLTWLTLVPPDGYFGGNPFVCDWIPVPEVAKQDNVLIRAIGIGVGVLTTVNYVELSFG